MARKSSAGKKPSAGKRNAKATASRVAERRRVHDAVHRFVGQLAVEVEDAIDAARARQLAAIRDVLRNWRYLWRRYLAPEAASGQQQTYPKPPIEWVDIEPDLAIGLAQLDTSEWNACYDDLAKAVRALEAYEGQPFKRKLPGIITGEDADVPAVWGWRTCGSELTGFSWQGRRAVVAFDSDVTRKADVKAAIAALVDKLKDDRAKVRVLVLPDIAGREKTGLDDFLVAQGPEALQRLLDGAKDWFSTLLDMLSAGLTADALDAELQPIYQQAEKAGVAGKELRLAQLRQRLKDLGYPAPSMQEVKRASRSAAAARTRQPGANQPAEEEPVIRFVAEGPDGRFAGQSEKYGLYDMRDEEPRQLTNFVMRITEDVHVADDLRPRRVFRGTITLLGVDCHFAIDAEDFGNNSKLTAAIYAAAGAKAEIHCKPEILRTAVSAVSSPAARQASTNFGWNADKTAYMVPGGQITANGFQEADASAMQVDLADQEFAKRLSLRSVPPEQLAATKRFIVEDLLQLCPDPKVGYSLLAGAALSVLYRFTEGMNRVLLWVVGLSGNGKSHMAKLVQNLFGDFPIAGEKAVISWASTVKRIQHEGYYFRDAMYLVDDYKPEHCRPGDATWLLQAYADSAARSRLRADATAAETREIRGLLVCTGEDVPDHSASATARLIKIPYPVGAKDLERGQRCQRERVNYPGVMADFIRHVIANNRGPAFAARVAELQNRYYQEVSGSDNDVRIASNFAMLAAAFEEITDSRILRGF